MNIVKKLINVFATLIIVFGGIFLLLFLFNIKPYVVLSGSMEPTIKTGSLCFINKNAKFDSIEKGDIIAYKLSNGTLVTHRVVSKNSNGLNTKGDNNKDVDGLITTKNNFVGKNAFWIPVIGYVFKAFQTTKGKIIYLTLIVVLFMIGLLFGDKSDKKKEVKDKE